jgi:ankyrin repeat protein
MTPLLVMAQCNNCEIVQELIRVGADIYACDVTGSTMLMLLLKRSYMRLDREKEHLDALLNSEIRNIIRTILVHAQ